MTQWQKFEQAVLGWLAGTMTGSIVKIALGALLAYAADHVGDLNAPGWAQMLIIVLVPVLINILNPADGRYGLGRTEIGDDPDDDDE